MRAATQVILCKPFLRTNPGCPHQAFIRATAARGEALSRVAAQLGRAPDGLKRRLLRWLGREWFDAVAALLGLAFGV